MTQSKNPWAQSYLDALDRASLVLPADRRAELLADVSTHLDAELADSTDEVSARAVLDRLGDPATLVAEAATDLPRTASTGPSGAEIIALLLMGIGGVVLPLLAPAVGVGIMANTPRWSAHEVRVAWGILGLGLAALLGGFVLMAMASTATPAAVSAGLLALGTVIVVGPAAAFYAASRPRG